MKQVVAKIEGEQIGVEHCNPNSFYGILAGGLPENTYSSKGVLVRQAGRYVALCNRLFTSGNTLCLTDDYECHSLEDVFNAIQAQKTNRHGYQCELYQFDSLKELMDWFTK